MTATCRWTELYALLVVWLGFAALYVLLDRQDRRHFAFGDRWVDPLYFSVTTTMTVGYGDYTPKTRLAKMVVIGHHLCASVVLLACLHELLFGCRRR